MQKKTLLIVDDNPDFLGLYIAAFKRLPDFEVYAAEDGLEAKDILVRQSIDLLITDLRMPKMNGFELVKWMRRHQASMHHPALIVTGEDVGPKDLEAEGLSDHAILVRKPIELGKLRRMVLDLIEKDIAPSGFSSQERA